MKNPINSPNYTVNDFIKELQSLNEAFRNKPIVIYTPNGVFAKPVIKQLLDDPMNLMQGWEHCKAALIQY